MKKKLLMFFLCLINGISLYAQEAKDTTSQWDNSKSNGGIVEKFGNKMIGIMQKMKDKKKCPCRVKNNREYAPFSSNLAN